MKDSPAEKGGLKTGDVIQEFNNTKITSVRQLQREVAQAPVNAPAKVKVLREKQATTLTVVLGEQPTETAAAPSEGQMPAEAAERFGFAVQDLTPELREQLKVPAGTGVVVAGVDEDGPAAKAGLRPGDVIAEVNRERVRNGADFARLVAQTRKGSNLLLLVQRDGNSRFVVVSPRQP